MMMRSSTDRPASLIAQLAAHTPIEFDGEREGAWIEVIRKMDEVYADLLRYEVDLEQKNAALEQAQSFISSVIESVSDILIVCDPNGVIQQVNPATVRLLEQPAEKLVGRSLFDLVDTGDVGTVDSILKPRLPTDVSGCELRFVMADGISDLFAVNGSTRYDHDGRQLGLVLTGRPVGELRQAYEALNKAHGELLRAQRQLVEQEKMASLGRLVAGVAHELNNPISFVYGNIHALERYRHRLTSYLQAVHEGKSADELALLRQEYKIDMLLGDLGPLIDGTLEGAMRVSDIVKNLRRLSFTKTGEPQLVDIERLLQTAVRWASRAKAVKAEIRINVEPGLKAQGNEGQIHQVIVNLVDNAIDAMRTQEKPVLNIVARRAGREVVVEVSDNGTGLPDAVIDKVFEPFFTTKPVGEGTGLGLWISYGMAREQGGSLTAANRAGAGAVFTLTLPVGG
jgi:two-component system sensor histidine kinase HupT/HoxJ